jgi:importin subunit beta-1
MKDPAVYVKDTTAWTLGRVCELHPGTIGGYLPQLIQTLAEGLLDSPRVAANVCWAIYNLAIAYEDDADKQTSPMSAFYRGLLGGLVQVADREDADENNLRASAYEAINGLIQSGAQDTLTLAQEALPLFIDRLEKTFAIQVLTADDRDLQNELQSLLCGVLQVTTQRLGEGVKPYADKLMTLFLQVFNAKSASVHEEALMAVGAIANGMFLFVSSINQSIN